MTTKEDFHEECYYCGKSLTSREDAYESRPPWPSWGSSYLPSTFYCDDDCAGDQYDKVMEMQASGEA